jgi:hypothetical protein
VITTKTIVYLEPNEIWQGEVKRMIEEAGLGKVEVFGDSHEAQSFIFPNFDNVAMIICGERDAEWGNQMQAMFPVLLLSADEEVPGMRFLRKDQLGDGNLLLAEVYDAVQPMVPVPKDEQPATTAVVEGNLPQTVLITKQ